MITKKVEITVGFVLKIITIAFPFCTSNQEPIEEKNREYPLLYRQKIDVGEKKQADCLSTLASCVSLEAIPDLHSCKSGYRQLLNDMSKDLCQQSELSPDPLHLSSENF